VRAIIRPHILTDRSSVFANAHVSENSYAREWFVTELVAARNAPFSF
jgi:hypothetical protein